ncbi:MAG TPA: DUF1559 domain-containing protein, partial [Gemmatales bacterium]|nr:DUF1559 domain-containing protein [Gemmatales bacterium]
MCRNKKRRGLTLVEVLVVLGIISLIMAMLIPAILFVRQASAALESSNNLKQIMLAIHQYELDYKKLPKLHSGQGSLHRAIIPYLELGNIFQSIAENNQVDSSDVYIKTYVSPIDPTQSPVVNGYSSYAANAQVFNKRRRLSTGVPDGATHTIAFAERYSFLIQHTSFSW